MDLGGVRVKYHARYVTPESAAKYQRKSDHISHFSSAKAFNVNGFLKRIFLDIKAPFVIRSANIQPIIQPLSRRLPHERTLQIIYAPLLIGGFCLLGAHIFSI